MPCDCMPSPSLSLCTHGSKIAAEDGNKRRSQAIACKKRGKERKPAGHPGVPVAWPHFLTARATESDRVPRMGMESRDADALSLHPAKERERDTHAHMQTD